MQPTPIARDGTEALREALEKMLVAVKAAAESETPPKTLHERAAVEEKRRRLLRLLAELTPIESVQSHPHHLVSPRLDPAGATSQASPSPSSAAESNDTQVEAEEPYLARTASPTAPHRFLGNVFSHPVPLEASAEAHNGGMLNSDDNTYRFSPADRVQLTSGTRMRSDKGRCLDSDDVMRQQRTRVDAGKAHTSRPRVGDQIDAASSSPPHRCGVSPAAGALQQHEWTRPLRSSPSPQRLVHLYDATTVTPSFWINVWPCFGRAVERAATPTRVLVRGCYRYFEDVVERAAAQTHCQPACPSLYTPEGCPVRSLQDLSAEQHYLVFPSGGFYRRQAVPTALLWLLYADARKLVQCS